MPATAQARAQPAAPILAHRAARRRQISVALVITLVRVAVAKRVHRNVRRAVAVVAPMDVLENVRPLVPIVVKLRRSKAVADAARIVPVDVTTHALLVVEAGAPELVEAPVALIA